MSTDGKRIIDWGVRYDTPPELVLNIRLANGVLMTFLIASIVVTSTYVAFGLYQAALLNLIAVIAFAGGLMLMRVGYTTLARLLVIILPCFAGYGISVVLGPNTLIQLIFLTGSIVSLSFFSVREKMALTIGVLFPVVFLIALEYTNYEPVFGLSRFPLTATQERILKISSYVSMWVTMLGHFSFFLIDRRKVQAQLISAEKMLALGRMATGIAHEINNPLQTIVGQAERLKSLAKKGALDSPDAVTVAEKIQSVAMRIGAIIRGLKALARDASGDPFSELRLNFLISLTLDQCHAELNSKGIEVIVHEIPETWTVIGREAQLTQVLLNLITNAQDAIADLKEKWIRIEAKSSNNYIDVIITDSGSGIPAHIRRKIFDPFFTTKPPGRGVGLGLSVSREFMSAHNGSLFYDETSAKTRFVVRIPKGGDAVLNESDVNIDKPLPLSLEGH